MVVVLVARFIQMVLQLFLRLTPTLPDSADLLRSRRCMGMLVRPMILRGPVVFFAHKGILPLDRFYGKTRNGGTSRVATGVRGRLVLVEFIEKGFCCCGDVVVVMLGSPALNG